MRLPRATAAPAGATWRRPGIRAFERSRVLAAQLEHLGHEPSAAVVAVAGDEPLPLSGLDAVCFPRHGYTRGDLMAYYAAMSPLLLPAIADRPIALKRFPQGVDGPSCYERRAPADTPHAVRADSLPDEGRAAPRRLVGGDLATLLYAVQLGAISVEPWHCRVGSLGYPDYAIVSLEPGPRTPFRRVADVALWVREELDRLGVAGIPKTSGTSGLHVVLPLVEGTPFDAARRLAELIARRVAERHRRETTVTRWVQSRPTSPVHVDYLLNARGRTAASVYSVRATPDATISTPLRWEDLAAGAEPRELTIRTIGARLREVGDLWAPAMRAANDPRRVLGDA